MTIGIIEDNKIFARRIKNEIDAIGKYEVLAAVDSVEAFHHKFPLRQQIDIIFLDLMLPGVSGLDAIFSLKKLNPEVIIIILTVKNDASSIFRALRAGANGYLLKSSDLNIKKQLDIIENGGSPVSPSIARKIFEHFNPPKTSFQKGEKQD